MPFFAGRQASEITTELVEDFIGSKRAVGGSKRGKALADSTIKVNLPTLRMILDYCVRRRWLAANPLRGEALWRPTPKSEQPDPFTQPALAALVTAAESLAPGWGLMVRVWAQSGPENCAGFSIKTSTRAPALCRSSGRARKVR